MYEYDAELVGTVEKAIYGDDNVKLRIDLGLDSMRIETCRLYGIDAPELKTGDKKVEGEAARDFLREKLTGKKFRVKTHLDRRDKNRRILVEIMVEGETITLNQQLIAAGHAVPYFGGKKA